MVKEIHSQEELNNINKGVVVVDCYALWCGPCKMLAPIIEELSESTSYSFYKVDVDNANDIANNYQIFSIPTLLIFKDNKLIDKLVGFRPKDALLQYLNNIK